jgi:hypothetical protein
MGNLELLNLNSKTWESPNSVIGWFQFSKIFQKLGTIEKTLGFWGFFFKELEKDNLLQSRVFENSQRTSGFPAISGKEMTVQGRFLYGFFRFFATFASLFQNRFFCFLEPLVKGPYTIP